MKVTTDAVQVLGGAGYTKDFPVERYMRETKVMQIFEGTNQIQRLVISRHLARWRHHPAPNRRPVQLGNTSAIVTGAASGLGAATAAALAAQGARVFGLDVSIPGDLKGDGITYLSADVTNEDEVRAAVAAAAEQGPLRTVVNCAGIGPSARILGRKGLHDLALYARSSRST